MDSAEKFDIKVNGSPLPPATLDLLTELRVHRPLNAAAQVTIQFADQDFKLCDSNTFVRNAKVQILFGPTSVFEGVVDAVGVEFRGDQHPEYTVTCYDLSYRMANAVEYKTYKDQTVEDVLESLTTAAASGLTLEFNGTAATAKWSTATSLCHSLADVTAQFGLCWAVDGKKLRVFTPELATANVELEQGTSLVRFSTHAGSSGIGSKVKVHSWDPTNAKPVNGQGAYKTDAFSKIPLSKGDSPQHSVTLVAERAMSAKEADARATALERMLAQEALTCRGETVDVSPKLVPGETVTISNVGTAFSGDYLVTEVEHILTPHRTVTRFRCGSLPRALLGGTPAPAPSPGLQPMIGIVTAHPGGGGQDEPAYPAAVKVKLPAMGPNYETSWAPVISPFAGANRGLTLIPDVNDQVVVVFEGGQLDRPLVIGSMWTANAKLDAKQEAAQGSQKEYRLVTKWGSFLALTEVSQSEDKIELSTKDGKSKIEMTPTLIKVISSDQKTVELSTGQASIVLKDGKDITIKGNNVTIEATQNLNLKGTSKLVGEGTGGLELKGATAKVDAQAKLDLTAGGITTIKGGMVKIN